MKFGGTIRVNRLGVCVLLAALILLVVYIAPKPPSALASDKVSLNRLLSTSILAAEAGGAQVVLVRSQPRLNEKSKGKTKEGAESLVTDADYKSHCVMYTGLKEAFPSLEVISEEKTKEKDCKNIMPLNIDNTKVAGTEKLPDEEVDSSKITVWIDPLDATQEYTENILNCVTTMVCIAYEGIPLIGVIHKPFGPEPRTHWAWINKGTSPSLESLKQKFKTEKNDSKTFIVSRSHSGDVIKIIKQKFGDETEIIHSGGAGYKILEVIAGNASAYVHVTAIKKWDICAGDAIITALKGRLSTLDDKDLEYSSDISEINDKGVIASMGNHNAYVEKLKDVVK